MNSTNRIILSKPFNSILKKQVIENVLLNCNLENLTQNYSCEGGFELPLTDDWISSDLKNKHLLKYHNARQLRFIEENDNIIGIRLKDDINYMTESELLQIKECIEEVVNLLLTS